MVGEKATTDITVAKDAQGFPELKQKAKEGGDIAKNTRQELEQKIGKSIVSNENYLHLTEGKRKKSCRGKKTKTLLSTRNSLTNKARFPKAF